jgi:hypothetical protein
MRKWALALLSRSVFEARRAAQKGKSDIIGLR